MEQFKKQDELPDGKYENDLANNFQNIFTNNSNKAYPESYRMYGYLENKYKVLKYNKIETLS